jgi:hypothetical protein
MAAKAAQFGPEADAQVEKQILLQTIDQKWREHLLTLEHLRSVVGFRGYAQRDPLNEYKTGESFQLFEGIDFDVAEDLVGGAAYDVHGTPLADATMAAAQAVDAVLLGAVGGPKYDRLDFSVKPERGLLRLRKEMDLYANLRPAQCFDALADFSSLKRELSPGSTS